MMKKYKILIPVLCVAAACSATLAFLAPGYLKGRLSFEPGSPVSADFTLAGSKYTPMLAHTGALELPPLQTDIGNIFYTMNPNSGAVNFYEYSAGGLLPYSGTVSTSKKTVTCSNQDIPVTLYYIEADGRVTGFGLFTAAMSPGTAKIYEYAFFKVTALPAGYGQDGVLLLVDFDKNNFWINDKVFTEAFITTPSGDKVKRLTTDNARTVDSAGALRSDWLLLTDDFLKNTGGKPYFLSSRDYTLDNKGRIADILSIAEPKPPRIVTGILGLWASVAENGITYLRATPNGFDAVVFADKKESVIKSFTGDYFKDYLRCGSRLFNKNTLVLTDLLTGADKVLSGIPAGTAEYLNICPDGSRAVVAVPGSGENTAKTVQMLAFYDLNTGTVKTVAEPLLFSRTNANFSWVGNNTLFHLRPANDDGTGLSYCFITMS